MLIGENLFTTFASTDAVAAHAATSNSQTANLMLQEAPKLDNNDLLLENLDFNLIVDEAPNHTNVSAPSTSINVEAELFDSVFKNDNDPLLDNILIDDNELKDIFSFEIDEDEKQQQEAQELNEIVIKHEDEFNFENFIDSRSHSLPVIPSSITKNIITSETLSPVDAVSPGSKRSYSTSNIGSTDDNRPSKKKNDLGCTPYARKQRNLPLPPVVPKGEDTASMKRARNTEAARRSRARKMERMTQLESKCETLLNENNELKLQIEQLKKLLEGK